ncbi:MAG: DUF3365 domain-containing protein [Cocleimonas sp.]|nr:DUF3365 domain-containing protein [Cocleimonas sp.]
MKKLWLLSALSLVMMSCGGEKAPTETKPETKTATKTVATVDKKAAVEKAKAISKALGGALKTELQQAMKAGGPMVALTICNAKAMTITAQIAKEQNAQLSRVSLKERNPSNVPNEWQKKVLEDFDQRAAKGEDIATMGFSEIVDHKGKKQLHFMKALPTGKVCLACHGAEISTNVKDSLAKMYPNDKATGYTLGQVRGAIVVIKDL